jgi:phosphoribosylaminoimidazole-succinocarboxamide synthase
MSFSQIRATLPDNALMSVAGLPFPKIATGKVREIFDLGDRLLIVATDRLSAFDVVMPNGVPGKGVLLTQISLWWFAQAAAVMPTHLVPDHDTAVRAALGPAHAALAPRSMLVRKLKPLPVEAIVRGYLAGSGWKEYKKTGAVLDHALPAGLQESSRLPEPIFTPSTKAAEGHDENITGARCAEILGAALFEKVKTASLALYKLGAKIAQRAGLILADTKFEFGTDDAGNLFLIDEVLTPDSSRYWPAQGYAPGRAQPSFDKQFVRDWLEAQPWGKTAPGPVLPPEIVNHTRDLYLSALEQLLAAEARPVVGIVIGSQSDWPVVEHAAKTLAALGIAYEARVLSAHRTPDAAFDYARTAKERGLKVLLAAAGMAAHLAGVVAGLTPLPVLGIPMESPQLKGLDSLLSTVQMPGGVPVATFAIGKAGAINAALFAAAILALGDPEIARALDAFRAAQTQKVLEAELGNVPA